MSDDKFGFKLGCGCCIAAIIAVFSIMMLVNPPQMIPYSLYNMGIILLIPVTIYIIGWIWWRKNNPPPRRTRIVVTVDQSKAIRSKTRRKKRESRDIDDIPLVGTSRVSTKQPSRSKRKSSHRVHPPSKKAPVAKRREPRSTPRQKRREGITSSGKALNYNIFNSYLQRVKAEGYQFLTLTKIKNDLSVSKSKIKKLYRILDHFCEKNRISRISGSRFALIT